VTTARPLNAGVAGDYGVELMLASRKQQRTRGRDVARVFTAAPPVLCGQHKGLGGTKVLDRRAPGVEIGGKEQRREARAGGCRVLLLALSNTLDRPRSGPIG
jgi:hypothetical protein